jgi:N-acyl-D-amino-acid deacylase
MTSFPAQRFRLTERGLVRSGMWADLVIFDPKTVADTATFQKPHSYSSGFAFVLVNGRIVIEQGKHTGAKPGQVLLGPGYATSQ